MGVHIPESILRVSEDVTIKVKVASLTDRQLKNIARQVKQGFGPTYSNSATGCIVRHILRKFALPHALVSSWRIQLHNISPNHAIWETLPQAVAISKIEKTEQPSWYRDELQEMLDKMETYKHLSHYAISRYQLSPTGNDMITEAAKKPKTIGSHPAFDYVDALVRREFESIDIVMDTERSL